MEHFFDQLTERIAAYRENLEREGVSADECEARARARLNTMSEGYYEKIMAAMTEGDYDEYLAALKAGDVEAIQRSLAPYRDQIAAFQRDLIENF